MPSVSSTEFQKHGGVFEEAGQREPATITNQGQDSLVLLSAAEYRRPKALAADSAPQRTANMLHRGVGYSACPAAHVYARNYLLEAGPFTTSSLQQPQIQSAALSGVDPRHLYRIASQ